MFEKIWAQLKEHKAIVFVVVAGVIFFIYMQGSGTSSSAATVDPNATDNSLAAAQLQSQTDIAGINAQSQAAAGQTAAASHANDLSYQLQSDANNLNANLADTQMADSLQALTTADTLQAGVQNHAIDAAVQTTQINTTAQTQQTRTLANALVQQSATNAGAAVQVAQAKSCSWYNPTCW